MLLKNIKSLDKGLTQSNYSWLQSTTSFLPMVWIHVDEGKLIITEYKSILPWLNVMWTGLIYGWTKLNKFQSSKSEFVGIERSKKNWKNCKSYLQYISYPNDKVTAVVIGWFDSQNLQGQILMNNLQTIFGIKDVYSCTLKSVFILCPSAESFKENNSNIKKPQRSDKVYCKKMWKIGQCFPSTFTCAEKETNENANICDIKNELSLGWHFSRSKPKQGSTNS